MGLIALSCLGEARDVRGPMEHEMLKRWNSFHLVFTGLELEDANQSEDRLQSVSFAALDLRDLEDIGRYPFSIWREYDKAWQHFAGLKPFRGGS